MSGYRIQVSDTSGYHSYLPISGDEVWPHPRATWSLQKVKGQHVSFSTENILRMTDFFYEHDNGCIHIHECSINVSNRHTQI